MNWRYNLLVALIGTGDWGVDREVTRWSLWLLATPAM